MGTPGGVSMVPPWCVLWTIDGEGLSNTPWAFDTSRETQGHHAMYYAMMFRIAYAAMQYPTACKAPPDVYHAPLVYTMHGLAHG